MSEIKANGSKISQKTKARIEEIIKCRRNRERESIVIALDKQKQAIRDEYEDKINPVSKRLISARKEIDDLEIERDQKTQDRFLNKTNPGCFKKHPFLEKHDKETEDMILKLWKDGVIPDG